MGTFNFSCICDLVHFHGTALMPLPALMKRYGCGEIGYVIFPTSFCYKFRLTRKYLLNSSYIFASLVHIKLTEQRTYYQ